MLSHTQQVTTSHRVKERNRKWNIMNKAGEAEGIQTGLKESVEEQIKQLQRKGDLEGAIIRVKIGGDGTCIGMRLNKLIRHTLLNDPM